jgi:O-antigen ligase
VAHLALALIGLITVVPPTQPFHDLPLTSFYSEWLTFVLGFAAGIALTVRGFWSNLTIPKVTLPLVGLVALSAVQYFLVQQAYLSQALAPALYLSWAILLVALASWLRFQLGTEYVLRVFAWFMLCGGILHALLGLAQYLDLPGYLAAWLDYNPPGTALSGNFGQANHFATQLMLASIALIYLFAIGRLSISLALPLATLLAFLLALSASRSVFLYLGAVVLLSAFGYWHTREPVYRRFLLMSSLLLTVFGLAQFLLPPLSRWLHQVMIDSGFSAGGLRLLTAIAKTQLAGGIELRMSEWHKAGLMFLQSPVWGVGLGSYGWYSFDYQALPQFAMIAKPNLFHHSHNLFTQFAAETGTIGLLLLFTLLWGWIKQYVADWRIQTNWFVGACLAVLFIHSNLEYPLWYSYFLGIAAFLLGVSDKRTINIKFTPLLGQITSAIALLLISAILLSTFVGYQTIVHANSLIYRTTPEHAAQIIQTVARNPLLTPWAEQVMATHGIPEKSMITRQLALTTRVMLYRPNPIKVRRQITYLALAGKTDDAIALLNMAVSAYPTHLSAYVCIWQNMHDEEMRPIIEHAKQRMAAPLSCTTR